MNGKNGSSRENNEGQSRPGAIEIGLHAATLYEQIRNGRSTRKSRPSDKTGETCYINGGLMVVSVL